MQDKRHLVDHGVQASMAFIQPCRVDVRHGSLSH